MSELDSANVSGTPADGAATSTPATPAAATPAVTPVAATQTTTQAPATGAGPGEGWIPSYRAREIREAAQREWSEKLASREAELNGVAERYRQQVLALTGVTPPPNPEVAAVKNQFGSLYPGLSKLEEKAAQLEALIERAGDLEAQTGHYWESYGRTTMDRLYQGAQTALGGPLTDEGKRALHSSFVGFVQSSPELTARYTSDPTIVDDFIKSFTSNFIDPVRRASSASVANRAPGALPQDTPSGAVRTSAPAPLKSLDDRAAAAWTQFQQIKSGT